MKYLEKKFTVAVSSPRRMTKPWSVLAEQLERDRKRKKPHEFEGGTMCGLCGMDRKAVIHVVV